MIKRKFLICCFIFIISWAIPAFAELRIGSFNVNHMGNKRYSNYDGIADIINGENFSIVALQEISSENGVKELINSLGGSWKYVVTKEPCNGECFAFIWDTDKKIDIESSSIWEKDTPLKRPPFIAGFRNGIKLYWLANVHIYHGKSGNESKERRIMEIQELERIYISVDKTLGYTILLGDFNMSTKEINTIQLPFKCYQEKETTLNKNDGYHSNYDHFCFNDKVYNELKPILSRVKAPQIYYDNDFVKYQAEISDHVPIRMNIGGNNGIIGKGKVAFKELLNKW